MALEVIIVFYVVGALSVLRYWGLVCFECVICVYLMVILIYCCMPYNDRYFAKVVQ